MATQPRLQTGNLPAVSETPDSATWSPARGKEMRGHLLNKLRPPPLVHTWDFWHEKPDLASQPPPPPQSQQQSGFPAFGQFQHPSMGQFGQPQYPPQQYPQGQPGMPQMMPQGVPTHQQPPPPHGQPSQQPHEYKPHLTNLHRITDVKAFWAVFNNFPISSLPQKQSVHLFHATVVPVWEDPRNARGGGWTFRIPKSQAIDFWREICLLAIGEQLQEAVKSGPEVKQFRDDICGVSIRPRFASTLVTVWNRDAEHEAGVKGVLECVLQGVPEELRPREGSYYYKKHREHESFDKKVEKEKTGAGDGPGGTDGASESRPAADAAAHDAAARSYPSAPPNTAVSTTDTPLEHATTASEVDMESDEPILSPTAVVESGKDGGPVRSMDDILGNAGGA